MTLQIGSEAPDFEADTAESAGLARKAARPPTAGEEKTTYPGGWKAPKPYLRIVPQPRA